jgi:hypothetical protein
VQKSTTCGKARESLAPKAASKTDMKTTRGELFDEKYRVVAVEGHFLTIRGIRSGKVLKIVNPDPNTPLNSAEYPPGKLIALSDPSGSPSN